MLTQKLTEFQKKHSFATTVATGLQMMFVPIPWQIPAYAATLAADAAACPIKALSARNKRRADQRRELKAVKRAARDLEAATARRLREEKARIAALPKPKTVSQHLQEIQTRYDQRVRIVQNYDDQLVKQAALDWAEHEKAKELDDLLNRV